MALVWTGIGFFAGILLMHCLAAARIAVDLAAGLSTKRARAQGVTAARCPVASKISRPIVLFPGAVVCFCLAGIDSAMCPCVHPQAESRHDMANDPSTTPQFHRSALNDVSWRPPTLVKGVEVKKLCKANGGGIQLGRFSPGTTFPDHLHTGPEFIYVLEGEVTWNDRPLNQGSVGVAEARPIERGFRSMTVCVFMLVYDLNQLCDSVRPRSGQ